MLQKIFNTRLHLVYEACKSALRDYRCEEVYGDYQTGTIEALKKSNFHDAEKILIQCNIGNGTIVTVAINGKNGDAGTWHRELNQLQEAVVLELISVKLT